MSRFGMPSAGILKIEALDGSLVVFEVTEFVEEARTNFGTKPAARCNVHELSVDPSGRVSTETQHAVLVVQTVFADELRRFADAGEGNNMLLCRVVKGKAKPGQKPPWLPGTPSAEDIALAERWLDQGPQHPSDVVDAEVIDDEPPF